MSLVVINIFIGYYTGSFIYAFGVTITISVPVNIRPISEVFQDMHHMQQVLTSTIYFHCVFVHSFPYNNHFNPVLVSGEAKVPSTVHTHIHTLIHIWGS